MGYFTEIQERDGVIHARVYRRGESQPVALFACVSPGGADTLHELLGVFRERGVDGGVERRPATRLT